MTVHDTTSFRWAAYCIAWLALLACDHTTIREVPARALVINELMSENDARVG